MKHYYIAKIILRLLGVKINKDLFFSIQAEQFAKGRKKYGHSLADCPADAFNWRKMALEEVIDLLQYIDKLKGKI